MQKLKTMILSVLADGRKLAPFVTLDSNILQKGKLPVQLYRMSYNTFTEKKIKITLLLIEIITWFLQKCKH
jgi:hypothetical protein